MHPTDIHRTYTRQKLKPVQRIGLEIFVKVRGRLFVFTIIHIHLYLKALNRWQTNNKPRFDSKYLFSKTDWKY